MPRPRLAAISGARCVPLGLALTLACNFDAVEAEGEFGRPIALGSGDASPLPRLAYLPEPCPGTPGGCGEVCLGPPETCDPGACMPVLTDSATAITMLADDTAVAVPERACFELRSAAQILDPQAEVTVLGDALSRFRFSNTPVVRLPRDPSSLAQPFSWRTGTAGAPAYVGGVIGGNLLREFAIRFAHRREPDGTRFEITFYREFPGSEAVLADQGRAAIPLQFPGLLLGKDITDVCLAGGESCDYLSTFDRERVASALRPSRMVLDACVAPPPATVEWVPERGRCRLAAGPAAAAGSYHSATGASGTRAEEDRGCVVTPAPLDTTDLDRGREASLVVATGVAGLILFEDSARRLLNDLKLPPCAGDGGDIGSSQLGAPACIDGTIGALELPGWPPAGSQERPLLQVRVRSVGLVPGLTSSSGPSACQRLELRQKALKAQCDSAAAGNSPRLAAANSCADAARETAAVLGEAFVIDNSSGGPGPNPARWITTVIVPADHPMVTAMRRDTSPEALQPDGLIGTALFSDSEVVLDYTDGTPGVRVSCYEPGEGTCVALPQCSATSDGGATTPACCYGLPEDLLISLISDNSEYACCAALSPATAAELNLQAESLGREPPCPDA